VISVGLDFVGRLGLEIDPDTRKRERQCIGEIVPGVGKQREASRFETRDKFDDDEGERSLPATNPGPCL
jgi:hypothetical protein